MHCHGNEKTSTQPVSKRFKWKIATLGIALHICSRFAPQVVAYFSNFTNSCQFGDTKFVAVCCEKADCRTILSSL